jgi:hypothetical protein
MDRMLLIAKINEDNKNNGVIDPVITITYKKPKCVALIGMNTMTMDGNNIEGSLHHNKVTLATQEATPLKLLVAILPKKITTWNHLWKVQKNLR